MFSFMFLPNIYLQRVYISWVWISVKLSLPPTPINFHIVTPTLGKGDILQIFSRPGSHVDLPLDAF